MLFDGFVEHNSRRAVARSELATNPFKQHELTILNDGLIDFWEQSLLVPY